MRLLRSATCERSRRVSRVLVMLEYDEGDPDNGEVFDLTELAKELRLKDEKFQDAAVQLRVHAANDYGRRLEGGGYEPKLEIEWNVAVAFSSSGSAGWLDDAVNASMPISQTTETLIKRVSKAEKNLEKLRDAVKQQRLNEAAAVRGKYPLARITQNPMQVLDGEGKD